jgi:hypothetical protein
MHHYEKNIVEIKNEYTTNLINIMRPYIYEGFTAIYLQADKLERDYAEKEKTNPKIRNPGVFKIFQMLLRDVPNLNDNYIEEETKRIKERDKCSEYFDDLVRSVVKSFIVLLTYNASDKKCKIVNEKYHESTNIRSFVHKCYIQCAQIFFNNPELFWHKFSPLEIKRNQREAYNLISEGIIEAIRKMLPIRLILEEYLSKDYIESEKSGENKNNKNGSVKNSVRRDLFGKGFNAFEENQSSSKSDDKHVSSQKKLSDKSTTSSNKLIETTESDDQESIKDIKDKVDNLEFDKLVLANHEMNKEQSKINNPSLVNSEKIDIKKSEINVNKDQINPQPNTQPTNQIKSETKTEINNNKIKSEINNKIKSEINNKIKSETKSEIKQDKPQKNNSENKKLVEVKDKDKYFNNLMKTQ